jgi:hypothetical protein
MRKTEPPAEVRGTHSKDLDALGQIGNSSPEVDGGNLAPGVQRCPLCGTPVRVVSGDEGTSHYRPA